jgi:hypothetical protein
MPRPPQYFFLFKQTIAGMLGATRVLSLRHFMEEYDYDDFLEGEAIDCTSPRSLASAFACRFLGTVPSEYAEVLSFALVSFLAQCSGRTINKSDQEAVKALVALPMGDEKQFIQWMDAYFRDVA